MKTNQSKTNQNVEKQGAKKQLYKKSLQFMLLNVAIVCCALTMTACSPGGFAGSDKLLDGSKDLLNSTTAFLGDTDGNASALDQIVSTLGQDAISPPLDEIEAALPEYDGSPYAWINEDRPYFGDDGGGSGGDSKSGRDSDSNAPDRIALDKSFEYYAPLDSLGRCGTCIACVGKDIMPTEERGSIGMVKPSGWHTIRYDNVEGKYLYNRCHLIAYQLTGENANRSNLITGTRYMNVQGMLPREELVADYIKRTGNHVLYRVTPVFEGDNLVASGVIMEAKSVEDDGAGLEYNVYVYNEQPGTIINHANGDSKSANGTGTNDSHAANGTATSGSQTSGIRSDYEAVDYVANTNTDKFHYPWCSGVRQMADHNKYNYKGDRQDLINKGYKPCGNCNP